MHKKTLFAFVLVAAIAHAAGTVQAVDLSSFKYKNSGGPAIDTSKTYDDSEERAESVAGELGKTEWSATPLEKNKDSATSLSKMNAAGYQKSGLMYNYSSQKGNLGKVRKPTHKNTSGAASQSYDGVRQSDLGTQDGILGIINALTASGGELATIDRAITKKTNITTTGSNSFLVVKAGSDSSGLSFTISQDLDFSGTASPASDYAYVVNDVRAVCLNGVISGCSFNGEVSDTPNCVYRRWQTNSNNSVFLSSVKTIVDYGYPIVIPYKAADMESCNCVTADCGILLDDFNKLSKVTSDIATGAATTIMANSNASLSVNKASTINIGGFPEVHFFGSKIDGAGSALDKMRQIPAESKENPLDADNINLGSVNLDVGAMYHDGDDDVFNAAASQYKPSADSVAAMVQGLPVYNQQGATINTCKISKDSMIDPDILDRLIDVGGTTYAEVVKGSSAKSVYLYAYTDRMHGTRWDRDFTVNVNYPEYIDSVKIVSAWNVDDWYAVYIKKSTDVDYIPVLMGPGHSTMIDRATGKAHAAAGGLVALPGKGCDPSRVTVYKDGRPAFHPLCGGESEIGGAGGSIDSTLTGFISKARKFRDFGNPFDDTAVQGGGPPTFTPVDITEYFRTNSKGKFDIRISHWIGGEGQMNVLAEIKTHDICIPIDKAVVDECAAANYQANPNCELISVTKNGVKLLDGGKAAPAGTNPPVTCRTVTGDNGCQAKVCKNDWTETRKYACRETSPNSMLLKASATNSIARPLADQGSYLTDPANPGVTVGMKIGNMTTLPTPDVRTTSCAPLCRYRSVATSTELNNSGNTTEAVRSQEYLLSRNQETLLACSPEGVCPAPAPGSELFVSKEVNMKALWTAAPDAAQLSSACTCSDGLGQAAAMLGALEVMKDDIQCLKDAPAPIPGSQGEAALAIAK